MKQELKKEQYAFLNDQFLKEDRAMLPVKDLTILRGYGIFDYLRVKKNKPLAIDLHLDRFLNSAKEMRLPVPVTKTKLADIIFTLIGKNDIPDSGIRLTLTGGKSDDSYSIGKPQLIITQSALNLPTDEAVQKGIRLVTYAHQRQLPHVKTIDYLMAIYLQPWIAEKKADEVLYHNDGVLTECPRANLFIVTQEKTIITPAKNILKGIMREQLLKLQLPGYRIREGEIRQSDITRANEAFITSTTKGILPVASIDDTEFRLPGAVTMELRKHASALL